MTSIKKSNLRGLLFLFFFVCYISIILEKSLQPGADA